MSCNAEQLFVVDGEEMSCDCPRDVGGVDVALAGPGSGVVVRHGKYRSRRICVICIERCMYSMRYMLRSWRGSKLLICYMKMLAKRHDGSEGSQLRVEAEGTRTCGVAK